MVKVGSFDLYDHFNSPVFLSKAINSPEPVFINTYWASIAAFARTSPFTFVDHRTEPSFWSKARTFPSLSDRTIMPKPAETPVDTWFDWIVQLYFPDLVFIEEISPLDPAKNKFSPLKAGSKFPNVLLPSNESFQLIFKVFLLLKSSRDFGSPVSVSDSFDDQNFKESKELHEESRINIKKNTR